MSNHIIGLLGSVGQALTTRPYYILSVSTYLYLAGGPFPYMTSVSLSLKWAQGMSYGRLSFLLSTVKLQVPECQCD